MPSATKPTTPTPRTQRKAIISGIRSDKRSTAITTKSRLIEHSSEATRYSGMKTFKLMDVIKNTMLCKMNMNSTDKTHNPIRLALCFSHESVTYSDTTQV